VVSRVRTERNEYVMSDFQKEIFSLSEISEKKKLLFYGDSNTGKTRLAGSLPPGRHLWLVGEPGYKSAALRGAKGKAIKITNTAKAWAATDWLEANNRYQQIDWIILDGASTMEKRFRLGYAAEAWDRSPETKRARAGRNLPDRPDYFNTQNFMQSWIGRLVDLDCNLMVTAHAYRTEKAEDAELLVFPGFQGKVTETANAIAGLMDVTAYMAVRRHKRTGERVYRTLFQRYTDGNGVQYWAGDKFDRLPNTMDDPTMPEILSILDGQQ